MLRALFSYNPKSEKDFSVSYVTKNWPRNKRSVTTIGYTGYWGAVYNKFKRDSRKAHETGENIDVFFQREFPNTAKKKIEDFVERINASDLSREN